MPEPLRVNVESLHHASSAMLDHMDTSRREHSNHDDELVSAAGKWNGEIAAALGHVATCWADKRAALHTEVGRIGSAMSEAVAGYLTTDHSASDEIQKSETSL
ncbi:hypothetical protein LTT02_13105 [Mycolicibacterium smegmatis]|uniref:hypothetical protein n=1 Tax=Mycolicibacterium smegmatis TaxID=1772 RepID=UPI0005D9D89E|nr:hypothetical protein [Mycolicibacterium smegmatis]MDF1903804.1 hypothetical protein [Mycolicibacterium smegmatis]MDF1910369.1 hypothetical protein [Mycolicibacterium smegmatis]MDF1922120.1 hypothetical protein [Mycolicibacterium smegmatis]MDF1927668.1 hypothetical protein [Mycolicibacterium smegmatis]UAK53460.1 hypothetical protein K8P01_23025 [Mycolicibacterium smegmatis]